MSRTFAAAVVVATALAGGALTASASVTPPAGTVGVLLQSPAPGDGGVPAGGTYQVAVYVDAADQTLSAPTDRQVFLTFPAGTHVASLERLVPGRDAVTIPVANVFALGGGPRPGQTVTDTAVGVDLSASAGFVADLTLDPTTLPGTILTTTATTSGVSLGSVSVQVVADDAALCLPGSPTLVCAAAATAGSPAAEFAPTRTVAVISWIPPGMKADHPGFPMDPMTWGRAQVHLGGPLPDAPTTGEELSTYLQGWIVSQGGGRLAPGGLNVTAGPTLRAGKYVVQAELKGANYGATIAGGVYSQSGEILTQRLTAEIAVVGPVVVAPRPVVVKPAPVPRPIKATPRLAG